MHVQVQIQCRPHPHDQIKADLEYAGKQLALNANSISVTIHEQQPLIAVLEFDMRRTAQYKVVSEISDRVEFVAWEFCEDITIGFS